MARIWPGRMTHRHDGELVVFLIGMTINRPLRPDAWLPVLKAMPPMLAELSRDSDSGMLGFRATLEGLNPTVIQYWSSLERLYDYASKPDAEHRPAWTAFNRSVRKVPGVVGVWHETYVVDRAESIYNGAPKMGLARFTEHVDVASRGSRARDRLASEIRKVSTSRK